MEVPFKVIQVFSCVNITKTFWIEDFFEDYSIKFTNQQKTKMKKYFIKSVKLFQQYDLIENNYKMISNGFLFDIDLLTSKNISEGFVIYEKLSVCGKAT